MLGPKPPPGSERRRTRRWSLSLPASLRWSTGRWQSEELQSRTRDVSEGGLGLEMQGSSANRFAQTLSLGGPVEVEVKVAPLFGEGWIRGRLVPHWATGPHVSLGVEFVGLEPEPRQALRAWVAQALA